MLNGIRELPAVARASEVPEGVAAVAARDDWWQYSSGRVAPGLTIGFEDCLQLFGPSGSQHAASRSEGHVRDRESVPAMDNDRSGSCWLRSGGSWGFGVLGGRQ